MFGSWLVACPDRGRESADAAALVLLFLYGARRFWGPLASLPWRDASDPPPFRLVYCFCVDMFYCFVSFRYICVFVLPCFIFLFVAVFFFVFMLLF